MPSRSLKKRPVRLNRPEDMSIENLERINTHFDDRIRELDERRIAPISKISDTSTATTQEIAEKLNELIDALNKSNLTNN